VEFRRLVKSFKKNSSILSNRNMKAFENSITMSDGNALKHNIYAPNLMMRVEAYICLASRPLPYTFLLRWIVCPLLKDVRTISLLSNRS
jgi:hypothetical protein